MTHVNHILAELLITDEPVVNTQEMSLLAFLLERVRDEVLADLCRTGIVPEPIFVRTNPPINSVISNFFWREVMRVVFVRKVVHLATHFFSATGVKHVLAELFVSYEPSWIPR